MLSVQVGFEFVFEAPGPTPTIWQVRPGSDSAQRVVQDSWDGDWPADRRSYVDAYGNLCDRVLLPSGKVSLRYNALVEVPTTSDDVAPGATQTPVEDLPEEALVFLLPSRFCWSDALYDQAWELFGATTPGWARVQSVCDWVHANITYEMGSSNTMTTASDVWQTRKGVCRDFTHLGMTFCRSLNVPVRYVSGYIPDIGVPPPDLPMDFCSWFEAWLGDRWWTFDPRNNEPRTGRVVIARGRDALDVAMVTAYGAPTLHTMTVWADEAPAG
ncbi:MAG: transglutaminase family protein [Acidimicrobiales bacterium]